MIARFERMRIVGVEGMVGECCMWLFGRKLGTIEFGAVEDVWSRAWEEDRCGCGESRSGRLLRCVSRTTGGV
jgi:hypothetical protein